jgi:hypothetical protein
MRTHTRPRFIVSSEGRASHQPQVFRASHTNSKILVPIGARTPNLTTAPLALSSCMVGRGRGPISTQPCKTLAQYITGNNRGQLTAYVQPTLLPPVLSIVKWEKTSSMKIDSTKKPFGCSIDSPNLVFLRF